MHQVVSTSASNSSCALPPRTFRPGLSLPRCTPGVPGVVQTADSCLSTSVSRLPLAELFLTSGVSRYGFVPESNPSFAVDMLPPSTLKPRLASAENALKTLPEFLVLDPVLWTADPASFIRTFLFFFRGLVLEEADTKGQSTEALASALVRKAPISEDNERLALAKASEFLDDAHNLADVYEPADTDCTAELVSAAKRLRAKELSAIDGGRRFINNYKS